MKRIAHDHPEIPLWHEPVNVRFDPVAMEFHWQPDGRFRWNALMFEPKECITRLRQNQIPANVLRGQS
jgi:hypothetical protein